MNGALDHDCALYGYTGPRTTWANGMNFIMNHDPSAESIVRPTDEQYSALPLFYYNPDLF